MGESSENIFKRIKHGTLGEAVSDTKQEEEEERERERGGRGLEGGTRIALSDSRGNRFSFSSSFFSPLSILSVRQAKTSLNPARRGYAVNSINSYR